ncbi:MAG: hypothetical protein AUH13_31060 [Acidobacteria bacterium 13_2_20CM_58_27]|nr:MAG: hypothetical protein AUH13_31060 [Acidobacteria bacterium 13_2_20CM_58_27]
MRPVQERPSNAKRSLRRAKLQRIVNWWRRAAQGGVRGANFTAGAARFSLEKILRDLGTPVP